MSFITIEDLTILEKRVDALEAENRRLRDTIERMGERVMLTPGPGYDDDDDAEGE